MDEQNYSLTQSLQKLAGRTITVYISAGGPCGSGLTGILLRVFQDRIELLQEIKYKRISHRIKNPLKRILRKLAGKTCNIYCCDTVRSVITIEISKITAVTYDKPNSFLPPATFNKHYSRGLGVILLAAAAAVFYKIFAAKLFKFPPRLPLPK